MEQDRYCVECKVKLYKRLCNYMPGGFVLVCSACGHEYTIYEHDRLLRDSKSSKPQDGAMVMMEGASSGTGKKLILGEGKEELMTATLKALLEEKEDASVANILASYENPIQEV